MKAIQIEQYGDSSVIKLNPKAPKPKASNGKVLVEVYASGINPADWKIREGYFHKGNPLKFPAILGLDFSGIIVEVGEGVTGLKAGDAVYGQGNLFKDSQGTFAEFVAADVKTVAPKPSALSHVEAGALPLVGVSVIQALIEHIKLSKDQKILIHGGSGGIGSIAIQIAKKIGAFVATTCSHNNLEYVKDLGADKIIDYQTQAFEEELKNYDAVLDTVGGETYTKSYPVLKKEGIIVSMLESPNVELMNKYNVVAIAQLTKVTTERLRKLAEFLETKEVKVNIEKEFALNDAAEAMDYVQKHHPRGKVVLKII